jgi:hypothetical protein
MKFIILKTQFLTFPGKGSLRFLEKHHCNYQRSVKTYKNFKKQEKNLERPTRTTEERERGREKGREGER